MSLPVEQNKEKSHLHTSPLISLFEQKGYECEEINCDKETIYVMKFDFSSAEKSFQSGIKVGIY